MARSSSLPLRTNSLLSRRETKPGVASASERIPSTPPFMRKTLSSGASPMTCS